MVFVVSSTAVLFGVLAAVFWGLSPALSKRGFTTGGTPLLASLMLVIFGTIGLWILTVITTDFQVIHTALRPTAVGLFVLGGVVGTAIGRLLNYSGVDAVGASVNSAGVATDPVFAVALGIIALGESVTVVQLLGVCLVVTGIAITVLSGGGNKKGWSKRALIFPFGSALAYGSGAVVRRLGLTNTSVSPIQAAAINETAALFALGGYALFQLDIETVKSASIDSYGYFIIAGIINTVGLVSFFVSIDNGPVVIGSTLAGMSTIITVVTASILLDDVETVTKVTIIGAVVTAIGALLVA